ncbi:MAG: hypothetical protein S4CHLAM2_18600 [Chlamydiales bacterium]|nr:hypothetical protein [Chlamydiales bacterium]
MSVTTTTVSEARAKVQAHFSCSTSTKLDSDTVRKAVKDELRQQQASRVAHEALRAYCRLVKSPPDLGPSPVSGNEVHLYLCVAGYALEELHLDKLWTHCSDWGCEDTVKLIQLLPIYCPNLKSLSISTCLSDKEVLALAETLPQLQSLEALQLQGALRSLVEKEVECYAFDHRRREEKPVPKAVDALFKALPRLSLKRLGLSSSNMRSKVVQAFLPQLKQLDSLEKLNLHWALDCTGCGDRLADAIPFLFHLTHLDLFQCWLRDEGAIALANVLYRCSSLQDLRLGNNRLSEKSILLLNDKAPCSLTYLDVSKNYCGDLWLNGWRQADPDHPHCFTRWASAK